MKRKTTRPARNTSVPARHMRRVPRRDGDELGQEAEVDADIAEHRPGERAVAGSMEVPFTTKRMVRNTASRPAMPSTMPR